MSERTHMIDLFASRTKPASGLNNFLEAQRMLDFATHEVDSEDERSYLTSEAIDLLRLSQREARDGGNPILELRIGTQLPFIPLMLELPSFAERHIDETPSKKSLRDLKERFKLDDIAHEVAATTLRTLRAYEEALATYAGLTDRMGRIIQRAGTIDLARTDPEFAALSAANADPITVDLYGLLTEQTYFMLSLFGRSCRQVSVPSLFFDDALGSFQYRTDATAYDFRKSTSHKQPVRQQTGVQIKSNPHDAHAKSIVGKQTRVYDDSVCVITSYDMGNKGFDFWPSTMVKDRTVPTTRALIRHEIGIGVTPLEHSILTRIRQGTLDKIETTPSPDPRQDYDTSINAHFRSNGRSAVKSVISL